jgi:hypothetical protein
MSYRDIGLLATLLAAAPLGAQAAPVVISSVAVFPDPGSSICVASSALGAPVTCDGSSSVPGAATTLDYNVSATASYGSLAASAQSSILDSNHPRSPDSSFLIVSQALPYFEEIWTITAITAPGQPSLNGQGGTLNLVFNVQGSYNCGGTGSIYANLAVQNKTLGGGGSADLTSSAYATGFQIGCAGTVNDQIFLSTNFYFGESMNLATLLNLEASLSDPGDNGDAYVDFTASLVGFSIMVPGDPFIASNVSVVTGTDYTDNSGDNSSDPSTPPSPPTAIPEPASLTLFGAGLIAATMVGWRKRTRWQAA